MLLHEVYRILKPQGTLVIIDCFRTAIPLKQFLMKFYVGFCQAWGLPNLISLQDCKEILKTEGFRNIAAKDLTKNVMRTIFRCDVLGIPYLFLMVLRRIIHGKRYRLQEDSRFLAAASYFSSIIGLAKGITYNVVTAVK